MDLTAYELARMATKAASGFSETGDLISEVAKIASENELTPPQIQTLVEESNHEVNRRLYSAEDDKRFAFKVATLDEVLESLNGSPGLPKVASVVQAGFNKLATDRTKVAAEATRIEEDWVRDPEIRLRETKAYLNQAREKIGSYIEQCDSKVNYLTLKVGETKARALGEVKQLVRNGMPFATLYKAAMRISPDTPKAIRGIFEGFHEDYSKTASAVEKDLLKFDPEALDGKDEIGTRFVNGNHPLFIHLDDMHSDLQKYYDVDTCRDGLRNTFSALTSAIHRLNTPEDVDSYLANESQRFAYAVKKGMDSAMDAIVELRSVLPKTDGHESEKTAGPRWQAFAANRPRMARALNYLRPAGPGYEAGKALVKAPFKATAAGAKGMYGKSKELLTTGKTNILPNAAGTVGKAIKSPLGLGTHNNPGLLALSGLLWAGSKGLQGTGEAASQLGRAALQTGGSRSSGVGLA